MIDAARVMCKSILMDFSDDIVRYSVKCHSMEVGHVVQTMEGCISEYIIESVIDSYLMEVKTILIDVSVSVGSPIV